MNTYENLKKQQKISDMTQPDEIQDILNNATMTKEQKVQAINAYYNVLKQSYQKEYDDYVMKQRLGAALEIGSAVIPMGGGMKLGKAGLKMGQKLAPQIVKNIAKRGAIEGAGTGAVFGLGHGLTEDENPLLASAQDAAIGALGGAALGTVGGKLLANFGKPGKRINNLDELLDKRADWGIAFSKQSGKSIEAINKLLEMQKGFVPKAFYKEGLGEIDLVYGLHSQETNNGYGLAHIIARRHQQGIDTKKFLQELLETIENGLITVDSRFPTRRYIEDINKKISIELKWHQKDRKWVVTAFRQNKSAGKRLMNDAPLSNITSENGTRSISELTADKTRLSQAISRTPDIANTGYEMTPSQNLNESLNGILPQNAENVNPAQAGVRGLIPLMTPILDGRVEMSVDESGSPLAYIPKAEMTPIGDLIKEYEKNMDNFMAEYTPKPKHIFTAEEIGKMKLEDFRKNEEEIMRQYKAGMILPRGEKRIDYSDYVNPIIQGLKKIFTREEIQTMKPEEYKMYENAIKAQAEKIGVPSEIQMNGASRRGDGVIYVRPYTRSDGTQVRGYWRSVN